LIDIKRDGLFLSKGKWLKCAKERSLGNLPLLEAPKENSRTLGVSRNSRVNFLYPNSVKRQECFSRTIQWSSIPLAGVRPELSAYAGLLNKLGFASEDKTCDTVKEISPARLAETQASPQKSRAGRIDELIAG